MTASIVFVFGAAGAGKTTFCKNMKEINKYKLINIDPAQENRIEGDIEYDYDICDHLTVDGVMNEPSLDFGPNGALFHCYKEMQDNLSELLNNESSSIGDDNVLLVDCPGQIELFLHSEVLTNFIKFFKSQTNKMAIVYLIESSNFLSDKILYSSLCSTITVNRFYLPVLHVLSKADQIKDEIDDLKFDEFLSIDKFVKKKDPFTKSLIEFVDSNGMFGFIPLDWDNTESVEIFNMQLNAIIQRDEDLEVKET